MAEGAGTDGELQGALCALHPDEPATSICTRCGNYACGACTERGRFELCPSCRQATGQHDFPFHRDNWSLGDLFSYCLTVWQRHWLPLAGAALIFLVPIYLVAFAAGLLTVWVGEEELLGMAINVASNIVQFVLQTWLQLGFFAFSLRLLDGHGPDFQVFATMLVKVPAGLLQSVLIYLAPAIVVLAALAAPVFWLQDEETMMTVIGALVLVLLWPLTYYLLGVVFAQLELVYAEGIHPIRAVVVSWTIARGNRLVTLAVIVLAIVVAVAGVLLCCFPVVITMGLAQLMIGSLFLALRTEPHAVGDT